MKYIIGRKIGMVQLFDVNGKLLPATVVQCEPNIVLKADKNRITVGYDKVDAKKLNKPQLGFFKKLGVAPYRNVMEFDQVTNQYKQGDLIKVNTFAKGELVDIQATTKGRGYTGAIVRWNYKCGPKSHGAGYPHRYQGSIAFGRGGSQGQRVPKGKKMAGQYGHEVVTIENLTVLDNIPKWNVLLILGAIAGPANGLVMIKSSVKKPTKKNEFTIISKEIKEQILEENEKLEDKEALHEANLEAEAKAEQEAKEAEAAKIREEKQKEAEAKAIEKASAAEQAKQAEEAKAEAEEKKGE